MAEPVDRPHKLARVRVIKRQRAINVVVLRAWPQARKSHMGDFGSLQNAFYLPSHMQEIAQSDA
jgi:hypothetical protein